MKSLQEQAESTLVGVTNRPWPLQTAYGAVLMLLLSAVIAVFPAINRLVSPEMVWFPLPMLAVGLCAVALCHRRNMQSNAVGRSWSVGQRVWLGSLAVVSLTVIGLSLTGWGTIKSGHATLHGDFWDAPVRFRNAYSVALGLVEGLTEEASMRGVVQIPIMCRLGSISAQFVAGAVFVVLHLLTRSGVAEFVFIGLTAIVCGMLTAAFRSVWVPAGVHAISNASIALVVLALRP